MTARSLLEQILKSGSDALGGTEMSKYTTGAVAGGALAMLLGPRRGASRTLLQLGGLAALGTLAWRAYQDHQARQGAAGMPAAPAAPAFAALPAPEAERHSQAMLRAMIAAAKSDGHLDERERGLLETELHRLEADPAQRAWVDAELRRPVEPAEVAAGVTGPEQAAEVYLASLLVVDRTTTMERAYLDELARQLKLPAALKADLEARAVTG
jgi:uncharacterized membrane protein YebE (DUF533 family)